MTDDAWANFIASIDPVTLEAERMRVHGNLEHERPGSRADHEMRHAHGWLRKTRNARTELERGRHARRLQEADADRTIRERGYDHIPVDADETEIDAAIRSYKQRQAARAARKAAA